MVRRIAMLSVLVASILGIGCRVLVELLEVSDAPSDASTSDGLAQDAPLPVDDDASTLPRDGAGCPSPPCTRCNEQTGACVIECSTPDCASDVICPPGIPCEIRCVADSGACESEFIDCSQATSCHILCSGQDACDHTDGIVCGGDQCTIVCSGSAACEDGPIHCTANTCSITCDGSNACAAGVCCGEPKDVCTGCTTNGGACECIP